MSREEFVHHIDQDRSNNEIQNLKLLGAGEHAKEHLKGTRNPNGRFIASEPIFSELRFRLHDKDRNLTAIYTLGELIATTYRRGKFKFRGRFTGLTDKNGVEIYEGDWVKCEGLVCRVDYVVESAIAGFVFNQDGCGRYIEYAVENGKAFDYKIIGNIYESKHLLDNTDILIDQKTSL